MAQARQLLEIDANSFAPVQTDVISGVNIDKIGADPSQRPCARIKMHINRMTKEDIAGLSVRPVGGSVVVTKQVVATEGNGLIVEMTAKAPVRFYLHHEKYGDSNEVSLNLEGNKEYKLEAMLNTTHSIVVNSNTISADVYIDDIFKGKIGDNYSLTISDIYPGAHKIKVKHGSTEKVESVEVNSLNILFRINLESVRSQFVVFEVSPKNASVMIDGKYEVPDQDGVVTLSKFNGSYSYTISAKDYHEEKGVFIVNGSKFEKSVSLRPAYGWLRVPEQGVLQGASVYVNGELIGKTPISNHKLSSGTYTVRIVKNLYKASEERITIEDEKTFEHKPDLIADFARVTINAGEGSYIYINDKSRGASPWSGDLAVGTYVFEARKTGHRTTSISKTIEATPSKQSYEIPAPTPILGTAIIKSTPAMANIHIDDKLVGKTPLEQDLIIGTHRVIVSKEGYQSQEKTITINEGKTEEVNISLSQKKTSSYSSNYSSSSYDSSSSSSSGSKNCLISYSANSKAIVYVNGSYKGYVGRSYPLSYGDNYVVVVSNGYYYGRTFRISSDSSAVLNMSGAPRVSSIYPSTSSNSSSSSVYGSKSSYRSGGSYNYKTTKASNKDDDFRVGIMADMAMILYDYTMFGLGVGINSGTKYNSIFPIFLGARWMAGFDNSHVIGFPFTINLNWLGLFAIDRVSLYSGFGVEPCWMKYNDRWSDYEDSVVKGWDCPLIVNLLGVSARHHDFNLYMNISLIDDDNITFGGRYTYFF